MKPLFPFILPFLFIEQLHRIGKSQFTKGPADRFRVLVFRQKEGYPRPCARVAQGIVYIIPAARSFGQKIGQGGRILDYQFLDALQ